MMKRISLPTPWLPGHFGWLTLCWGGLSSLSASEAYLQAPSPEPRQVTLMENTTSPAWLLPDEATYQAEQWLFYRHPPTLGEETAARDQLLGRLGSSPLALYQLDAYLTTWAPHPTPYQAYWARLEYTTRVDFPSYPSISPTRQERSPAEEAADTTLAITLGQLKSMLAPSAQQAIEVLLAMACCAARPLPSPILATLLHTPVERVAEHQALGWLLRSYLIQKVPPNSYRLHTCQKPLIQAKVSHLCAPEQAKILTRLVKAMRESWQYSSATHQLTASLAPHLEVLWHAVEAQHEQALPLVGPTMELSSYFSQVRQEHDKAIYYGERLLEFQQKHKSKNPMHVIDAHNHLAALYLKKGELNQALELYTKVKWAQELLLGKENLSVALTCSALGDIHLAKGDCTQAAQMHEQALALLRTVHHELHPAMLESYTTLGRIYMHTEAYHQAILTYEKATQISSTMRGETAPSTVGLRLTLGELYLEIQAWDLAIDLYKKMLCLNLGQRGSMDPDTAWYYSQLGNTYQQKDDPHTAIAMYRQALHIQSALSQQKDAQQAYLYSQLGQAYEAHGDISAAIGSHEQALAGYQNQYGAYCPELAHVYNRLSLLYSKKGCWNQVMHCYVLVLNIWNSCAPEAPEAREAAENIAFLLEEQPELPSAPLKRA